MAIKNNTTSLQELLEVANNLPEAGSSGGTAGEACTVALNLNIGWYNPHISYYSTSGVAKEIDIDDAGTAEYLDSGMIWTVTISDIMLGYMIEVVEGGGMGFPPYITVETSEDITFLSTLDKDHNYILKFAVEGSGSISISIPEG